MCLAAFAFGVSGDYPMVFAANRDEHHARPTAAAHWWTESPHILGGRDLLAGGTWLAVDQSGRLAAVTNVPSPSGATYTKSRGHLVTDYLAGEVPAQEFISSLQDVPQDYGPYNLLLFDGVDFHYFNNQTAPQQLSPGAYALSNAPLGTPWPKVNFAAAALESTLATEDPSHGLLEMLENRESLDSNSDRDPASEREARVFIEGSDFGTRSSTIVTVTKAGSVRFLEHRHHPDGTRAGDSDFRFSLASAGEHPASR